MILLAAGLFMGGAIAYLTDEQALVNSINITESFPTPTPTVTPTPSPAPTAPLKSFRFKVEWIGLDEGEPEPNYNVILYRNVIRNDKKVTGTSSHRFEMDGDGFYHAWAMRAGDYWMQAEKLDGFITMYRNASPNTLVVDKLYSGGTLVFYKIPHTGDSRVSKALLLVVASMCAAGLAALLLAGSRREVET